MAETKRFLEGRRQSDNKRDIRGADRVRDEQQREPPDRSGNRIALSHRSSACFAMTSMQKDPERR
jgi:hypothetical protein